MTAGDDESWTLSAVGDWDAYARGTVSQTRTHGGAHELTQVTEDGTPSTLTYDARGNLTADAPLQGPNTGRAYARDADGVPPKRPDRGRSSLPV